MAGRSRDDRLEAARVDVDEAATLIEDRLLDQLAQALGPLRKHVGASKRAAAEGKALPNKDFDVRPVLVDAVRVLKEADELALHALPDVVKLATEMDAALERAVEKEADSSRIEALESCCEKLHEFEAVLEDVTGSAPFDPPDISTMDDAALLKGLEAAYDLALHNGASLRTAVEQAAEIEIP